jgi:hypothetical protein
LEEYEPVGEGFRRVLRECISAALSGYSAEVTETRIHRARQALKLARSLLRLAEELGVAGAKASRRRLNLQARWMSASRDAAVVGELSRGLAKKLQGAEQRCARDLYVGVLRGARRITRGAERRRQLAAERQQIDRFVWPELNPAAVEHALPRFVRRLKRRAKVALRDPDLSHVHDWRKAVIVLRNQLAAAGPVLGCETDRSHHQLRLMAKRLGEACDWQVFIEAMEKHQWSRHLPPGHATLLLRVLRKQKKAVGRALRQWPKLRRTLRRELGGRR